MHSASSSDRRFLNISSPLYIFPTALFEMIFLLTKFWQPIFGMHAIGKILKLARSSQALVYIWRIAKLESSKQHKTFQFKDFSNCPFQLHVSPTMTGYHFKSCKSESGIKGINFNNGFTITKMC